MKFPRNARMFTGHLDAAPFACVLFCLLIFLLLALVVPIPGIPIHLSDAMRGGIGVEGDLVTVTLDAGGPENPLGVVYFQNQIVNEKELLRRLKLEVKKHPAPPTLVLLQDKNVTTDQRYRVMRLAQEAGIEQFSEEILPGVFDSGATRKLP